MDQIVGRERELELLEQGFVRLARGEGGVVQLVGEPGIGKTRLLSEALEQARALCHRAAYVVDSQGNKEARHLIAAAKVAVPRAVTQVIDRAIQVHGGAGISDATPLAAMYGWHRAMRIFDGPDEVHLTSLARAELNAVPLFELPPTGP